MSFVCKVCDRSIIENESEFNVFVATRWKKYDKSLYKNYTKKNVNLAEVDKILNDYITTHINYFNFYLVNCEFVIEFDNNFTEKIETNYLYNTNHIITKVKGFLFYWIACFRTRGYQFYNISQINNKTISDRCNMTYEHYMNQPMHMCERQKNMNIAKNTEL